MNEKEQLLNRFLVGIFNDILRLEDESLSKSEFKNLSVTEMHVIDAVANAQENGTNTMAQLAKAIKVTASTLTIAVKTLEQKGYLVRCHGVDDRRKVLVTVTPLALSAIKHHDVFHQNMVQSVSSQLTDFEMDTLSMALSKLRTFFKFIEK
ncbi:MAG: MarR family transcriptional regulator [Oscillospiraceae bacterium]